MLISKAVEDAKKNTFVVPRKGTTMTHEIVGEFAAARVLLRPASEGTGVIAGGGVRAALELGRRSRHPREEPWHDEPDQHAEGDRQRSPAAAGRPVTSRSARGLTVAQVLPIPKVKVEDELTAEVPAAEEPVAEAEIEETPA